MDETVAPVVMVVTDDEWFGYLAQRYVKEMGCGVLVGRLGVDTLALAQQQKPAAVVLEVGSPELLGLDILRMLQEDSLTSSIPVIVCSWPEEKIALSFQGTVRTLHKPILYRDMLLALADAGVPVGKPIEGEEIGDGYDHSTKHGSEAPF